MKGKLIAVALALTGLVACASAPAVADTEEPKMFYVVDESDYWYYVVCCRSTGVLYAVSDGSYNHGTFTLLVNADGTPMTIDDIQ